MSHFISYEQCAEFFRGKSVAIIGSAPSCLNNVGRRIDSYDVIVRIQNSTMRGFQHLVGSRTDVVYSFFGGSFRKTAEELRQDGVYLCMSKIPNSKPFHSDWYVTHGKEMGHDYRPHYRRREGFWFCPTFVPTDDHFMKLFNLLGKHQPTTGFTCIHDILGFDYSAMYITGFDGFRSGMHNVDEPHRVKNIEDPHGHRPEAELRWLAKNLPNHVKLDNTLTKILGRDPKSRTLREATMNTGRSTKKIPLSG